MADIKNGAAPAKNGLCAERDALVSDGERADDLQYKGLRIIQSPAAFCFGTDSVILTHFALEGLKAAKRSAKLIDLGSGSGVIALLLAAKTGLCVTAVEIEAAQCERFERTLKLNGITRGIEIVNADYLDPALKFERKFDHAVCNPPYFKRGSGGSPKNGAATHEESADIFSIAKAVRRQLKFGGSLSLCFPTERLAEALTALSVNALEPKVLRLVKNGAEQLPYLALIRAKYGAKPGLRLERELVIRNEEGRYTEEMEKYYNGE